MLIGSVVLAGGDSQRMGEPKTSLAWGDATLLTAAVDSLLECCFPVVVVAQDRDQELPPLDTESELAFDSIPGGGPLIGALAGIEKAHERCDAVMLVGCDFPFVNGNTIDWLCDQLGDANAAIPTNVDTPQPLCAIYRCSVLPQLRELVEGGERTAQALAKLSGVRLIDDATVTAFDSERRFLWNVNSREDYDKAREWMS